MTSAQLLGRRQDEARPPGASRFVSREALTAAFAAFVMSRALTAVVALMARYEHGRRKVWTAWDSAWYERIARHGYPTGLKFPGEKQSEWAFFPLYPMLERAVHSLGVPFGLAGLLINAVCDVALVVLLAALAERLVGAELSGRTSALFWFFPGTAVLSLSYSEPLYLVLVCATLLALLQRRWLLAGLLTALAGATRSTALALMAALLVAAVLELRRGWAWRPVVAVLVSPLGLLGYLAYAQVHAGHWNEWLQAERLWSQSVDASLGVPRAVWINIFHIRVNSTTWLLTCLTGAAVLAALVLLWRRRALLPSMPVSFWVYSGVGLALVLSSTYVSTKPRFVMVLVPLFVAVAATLSRRVYPYVLAGSAALLPLTMYLYLTAVHVVP